MVKKHQKPVQKCIMILSAFIIMKMWKWKKKRRRGQQAHAVVEAAVPWRDGAMACGLVVGAEDDTGQPLLLSLASPHLKLLQLVHCRHLHARGRAFNALAMCHTTDSRQAVA